MYYNELLQKVEDNCQKTSTPFQYQIDDKTKIFNTNSLVVISKGVVKTIWNLAYISYVNYNYFIANTKPKTPKINPNTHPSIFEIILEKRRHIEKYFTTEKENCEWGLPPDPIGEIINPSYQPYIDPSLYYIVNEICSYALLFWSLHEVGHNKCTLPSPQKNTFGNTTYSNNEKDQLMAIEKWCDSYAFKRYKKIFEKNFNNSSTTINCAKIGIQTAMLFLATRAFDQQSFDGTEHPEVYTRIKDIMNPISPKDDISWSFLNAFLSFELKDIRTININHSISFKTHKDAVGYLLGLIKKYDEEQCKGKTPPKKRLYLASDYGIREEEYYDKEKKIQDLKDDMLCGITDYWIFHDEIVKRIQLFPN